MINSTTNPKIKNILKLRKTRERRAQNLMIVEGYKEIMMAVRNGYIVSELYYCTDCFKKSFSPDTVPAVLSEPIGSKAFERISLRENPDGFLALVKSKRHDLADIKLSKNPLLIVLEAVEKPGNLGAVLRTADAVRADGVIVCEQQTDIYNPNVIRASLGTVFSVPMAVSSNEETLKFLMDNKINIFAATPEAKEFYSDADFTESTAILVGTEHDGLSDFWLKKVSQKIKIPMKGQIDSLNASVSTAVLVYEALRQRNG